MMSDTLITLTVLGSLTSVAVAAPGATSKLPKEAQMIQCLAGTWVAKDVQVTMDGKKSKAEATIACVPASGGYAVVCNTKIVLAGVGTIEETDLFGFDPEENRYHWYAVTSRGDTHDHVAMPPGDKDTGIVFAHSGFKAGKPMQEVIRLAINAEHTKLDLRNEGVIGGQSAWTIVAAFSKK